MGKISVSGFLLLRLLLETHNKGHHTALKLGLALFNRPLICRRTVTRTIQSHIHHKGRSTNPVFTGEALRLRLGI